MQSQLVEDIDLEPYTDFDLSMIKGKIGLSVESNEGDQWEFKFDAEKHTVRDLKRCILNKKGKAFFTVEPCSSEEKIVSFAERVKGLVRISYDFMRELRVFHRSDSSKQLKEFPASIISGLAGIDMLIQEHFNEA